MSGVRVARSLPPPLRPRVDAQVQVMQDVLYDILANGVDPDSNVSVEVIEAFLHEHARAPKSATELTAFFAQHGLSTRPDEPPPAISSLPPIERVAPTLRAVQAPPASPHPAPSPSDALEPGSHPVSLDLPFVAPRKTSWVARVTWALGLTAAAALLGAGGYLVHQNLGELRHQVAQSELEAAHNRAMIESLRSQAVTLESSVAASGELIQRMENKSDLVLDSIERAAAQPRRKH